MASASKSPPTFTTLPSELQQSIISFAINGPHIHLKFLNGTHPNELEVITDMSTILSLLLVSKQTASALRSVLSNFHLPEDGRHINAPDIVKRFAQRSGDLHCHWPQHVRCLTGSAMLMSTLHANGDSLGQLCLPDLRWATVVLVYDGHDVDLGMLWGVRLGGIDVAERMKAMLASWPAVDGGIGVKQFVNAQYSYNIKLELRYRETGDVTFSAEAEKMDGGIFFRVIYDKSGLDEGLWVAAFHAELGK